MRVLLPALSPVLSALLALPLCALGCPAGDAPSAEGEGEGEQSEGEGEEGEGEEGEGEGEGAGEGEGEEGEGEGEGEGEACGEDVVDGSGITGTEGVVVGRDGTVYFSQSEGVGRRLPNGTLELDWLALPGADTVWGVMLSPDNTRLYAASPTTASIFVVDVADAAVDFELTSSLAGPNGLTVDDDGTLFVADFFNDIVFGYDVGVDEATTTQFRVTRDVPTPNGVLVDGDDVLVLGYNDGELHRILGGRTATGTDSLVVDGLGSPDGIVRAADGSFFVTDNGGDEVLHVDGTTVTPIASGISAAANLEFGVAPLRCDRLLVTSSGALRVLDVGQSGAPVPWR